MPPPKSWLLASAGRDIVAQHLTLTFLGILLAEPSSTPNFAASQLLAERPVPLSHLLATGFPLLTLTNSITDHGAAGRQQQIDNWLTTGSLSK